MVHTVGDFRPQTGRLDVEAPATMSSTSALRPTPKVCWMSLATNGRPVSAFLFTLKRRYSISQGTWQKNMQTQWDLMELIGVLQEWVHSWSMRHVLFHVLDESSQISATAPRRILESAKPCRRPARVNPCNADEAQLVACSRWPCRSSMPGAFQGR